MMPFTAFEIDRTQQFIIENSVIGRIVVRTWAFFQQTLQLRGSLVVLPTRETRLTWHGMQLILRRGCYAQTPAGDVELEGGAGLTIETPAYTGLPQAGGPVEDRGRLHYIDGCSDSLLICPAKVGDPCLNLLHLPAGTTQTEHTHPSERIGIILRGRGVCRTPEGDTPLAPGMFWFIPKDSRHSFHTDTEPLQVLAWHPDSDFGPSHDQHPMLNRTIVEGVAATDARHAAIRTV